VNRGLFGPINVFDPINGCQFTKGASHVEECVCLAVCFCAGFGTAVPDRLWTERRFSCEGRSIAEWRNKLLSVDERLVLRGQRLVLCSQRLELRGQRQKGGVLLRRLQVL